jgi:hypothetical protein
MGIRNCLGQDLARSSAFLELYEPVADHHRVASRVISVQFRAMRWRVLDQHRDVLGALAGGGRCSAMTFNR